MRAPRPHPREDERNRLIEHLRLVEERRDDAIDATMRLLSASLKVPISLFSVVYRDLQFFSAGVGLDTRSTSRDVSFCGHVVESERSMMVVRDARSDERFADNPLVTGEPGIRFYAGALIRSSNRLPIGTVCAIDREPRELDLAEKKLLLDAANVVETLVRQREQALFDPSSSAFGAVYFDVQYDREWRRAARQKGVFSLVLVTCSPTASDSEMPTAASLAAVGDVLSGFVRRANDFCARLNSDTFAVVLPSTSQDDLRPIVDEMAEKLVELGIDRGHDAVDCWVAAGAMDLADNPGLTSRRLLARIREALLAARERAAFTVTFVTPDESATAAAD